MSAITQEQYREALIALHDCTGTEEEANNAIIIIMAKWNVTFKPEPILPDCTEGDWEYKIEGDDAGHGEIHCHRKGKALLHIATAHYQDGNETDANRAVMAGSKKLVELTVKYLRGYPKHAGCSAVLVQLKEMGIDVTEFEE